MKRKNVPIINMSNLKNFFHKNNQFSKLIIANAISRFGDSIDMIAFSWLIYQITGSAAWSAIVVGVNQLVSVIFQPIIGSVVENMNKKKVMVFGDIFRFLSILIFVIAYRLRIVNPIMLLFFTAIVSFIETFRIPAGVSIIPGLLEKSDYDRGISLNNSISKCCELIGLVSAAALIAYFGTDGVIFIDGITFLVSGILVSTMRYTDWKPLRSIKSNNCISMTKEGAKFLWNQKSLLVICVLCGLINASVIPFDSLQSAYVNLYFDAKVQILSAVSIVISIGMLIGSMLYQYIPEKYLNMSILTVGGIIISFFYLNVFAIAKISILEDVMGVRVVVLLLASFIVGIALAFMNNYVQIYFIREVKQEFLARISSISTTITTALSPITAFIVGILTTIFDTATVFFVCAVVIFTSFVFLCNRMKRLRKMEG